MPIINKKEEIIYKKTKVYESIFLKKILLQKLLSALFLVSFIQSLLLSLCLSFSFYAGFRCLHSIYNSLILFKHFCKSIPLPKTFLNRSPFFSILCIAFLMVNWEGCNPGFTSFHSSGIETVAPLRGLAL